MFGKYFEYDGESSESYNLYIAGFESIEETPMGLSREILKGEVNKYRPIANHMGTYYSDTLSFHISFIKDPCEHEDQNDMIFTEEEIDRINAWLTSPNYPTLFHMYAYEDEDNKRYDYFGIFTEVSCSCLGEDIVGLDYVFVTNAPYAWSQEIRKTFPGGSTAIIDVNNSDRYQYIYPKILVSGSGNVKIVNVTDSSRELSFTITGNETTVDCQKSIFLNNIGIVSFEALGMQDVEYVYWPKLYNGNNRFNLSGSATFTFIYREPRKVGAY